MELYEINQNGIAANFLLVVTPLERYNKRKIRNREIDAIKTDPPLLKY